MGLRIVPLEDDQAFQDCVLSIHHAFMITFGHTPAISIIENSNGKIFAMSRPINANTVQADEMYKIGKKISRIIKWGIILLALIVIALLMYWFFIR